MVFWPNSNGGGSLRETSQQDLAKKYGIEAFEHPYADSGVKNIGFAPTTKKWYGWSHRAIYGFTVGDTVKKGDIIAQGGEFARPDRTRAARAELRRGDARRVQPLPQPIVRAELWWAVLFPGGVGRLRPGAANGGVASGGRAVLDRRTGRAVW
jgi:hypothetical protein